MNPTEPIVDTAGNPREITDPDMIQDTLDAWDKILRVYNGKASYAIRNLLKFVATRILKFAEHDRRLPAFVNLFCNRANRLRQQQRQGLPKIVKATGACPNPEFIVDEESGRTLGEMIVEDLWRKVKSEISTGINTYQTGRACPGKDDDKQPLPSVALDLSEVTWDGDDWNRRLDTMYKRHVPSASDPLMTPKADISASWAL
jgi:hypothetical protein